MKPDHEDPNNHVPEISPEDDWDDLDSFSSSVSARSALPPRRGDHSLPPKKEPKQLHVQRHEPRLKVDDESAGKESSELLEKPEPKVSKKATGKTPQKKTAKSGGGTARKAAKKAAKKSARKRAAKKPARKSVSSDEGSAEIPDDSERPADESREAAPDEKILLPAPSDEKRGRMRVHEISGKDDGLASIQRMPKMTPSLSAAEPKATEKEVGRKRRRFVRGERSDWGEEGGGGSFMWMVFSGVGIILLVVFAVFLSQRGSRKPGRESDKSFFSQLEATEEETLVEHDDLGTLERLTNSQGAAREMYGTFATAKSVDDFAEMLFDREEIMPLVREKWKPSGAREGWTPDDVSMWTTFDRDGLRYGLLKGTKDDFTDFSAFFRYQDSDLKIDWKATTGYGTASFEELAKGKGDGSEIRCWISPSDFYTFPLPEEVYRSYRLVGPDGDHTLWAYAKRDGDLDSKLLKLFMPSQITGESQSEAQVVMELEPGPEESLPNQWIIKDIIHMNWLAK